MFARKAGVKRGLMTGVGIGVMWLFIYLAYALAFWYGTGLILDAREGKGDYDPAKLIIVSLILCFLSHCYKSLLLHLKLTYPK